MEVARIARPGSSSRAALPRYRVVGISRYEWGCRNQFLMYLTKNSATASGDVTLGALSQKHRLLKLYFLEEWETLESELGGGNPRHLADDVLLLPIHDLAIVSAIFNEREDKTKGDDRNLQSARLFLKPQRFRKTTPIPRGSERRRQEEAKKHLSM